MSGERFQPNQEQAMMREKADRFLAHTPTLINVETPDAVSKLLAGQDVNEVSGGIFRLVAQRVTPTKTPTYLELSRFIAEHATVDSNRVFSDYMQGVSSPLKPKVTFYYRSLGEIYAPHFPKTVDARTQLMSAWENFGFKSLQDAWNRPQVIKMQLGMVDKEHMPNEKEEPELSWITTIQNSLPESILQGVSVQHMNDTDRRTLVELASQGVALGIKPEIISRLCGVSSQTIKDLVSKPFVERAKPQSKPPEPVVDEREAAWIRTARAINITPGERVTPEVSAIIKGIAEKGLALGFRPSTMAMHIGIAVERFQPFIAEIESKKKQSSE